MKCNIKEESLLTSIALYPLFLCFPFIWVPYSYMNSFLQYVFILVLGHEVKYCYAALTL